MTSATIRYVDEENGWRMVSKRIVAEDRDKLERRIAAMVDLGLYMVGMVFHDEGQGELVFD